MGEEVEDITARLRTRAGHFDGVARFSSWTDEIVQSELDAALTREAADTIDSLRASLTRAREAALEEAALAAEEYCRRDPFHDDVAGAIRALKAHRLSRESGVEDDAG